jgi:hypothetical protein
MYLKDNKWKRSLPEKIKLYVPELMTSQIVSMTMKRIIKETAVALGMKDIDIMLCFVRDFENGGVKILVKHADLSLYNQKEIDVLDINKIFG